MTTNEKKTAEFATCLQFEHENYQHCKVICSKDL